MDLFLCLNDMRNMLIFGGFFAMQLNNKSENMCKWCTRDMLDDDIYLSAEECGIILRYDFGYISL